MRSSLPECRETIVLCGPALEPGKSGYGAGKGGYVRNVAVLLQHFTDGAPRMTLSPYSTRQLSRGWMFVLPWRLLADLATFARNIRHGGAAHIMMTYGLAIYREFGMSVIAAAVHRPVILDIRGGSFVPWLESTGRLQRALAHWILEHATVILGQGVAVVNYLRPRYGAKVHHFPNFVQAAHLPVHVERRCMHPGLSVIFVGYCYPGKGVFELVAGCAQAALAGLRIELTLVGAESPEFRSFLDGYRVPQGLTVKRRGALEFDEVQSLLATQDVFCFPTRHTGEGHPNAITEAMAHALVIVTTRHGFIPELLDDSTAYFVDSSSAAAIAEALLHVDRHRDEARTKADKARSAVQQRFMEAHVLGRLRDLYRSTLNHA